MSRAQRRRFDRHQPSVDRVTAADAAYFERWPERRHADDFDLSEAEARALYNSKVRPGSYQHRVEVQMRAALTKMGESDP